LACLIYSVDVGGASWPDIEGGIKSYCNLIFIGPV
jgi:hypothetical protein